MNNLFEQIPNERTWNLISRDTKGKIRIAIISYEYVKEDHKFIIHRITGQLGGKRTSQPDKEVLRGKATRNLWQQVDLEAKHLVKEKLDKGYKEIEDDPDEYSEEQLSEILGEVITSQDGIPKPMLAKQESQISNRKIFDNEWYASVKINGVRALIYKGEDGYLHANSRGAIQYDLVLNHILYHPKLIELFNRYDNLIMDGEIYNHFTPLNEISGICRSQQTAYDGDFLQFYWYDILDINKTFEERLNLMNNIKKELNLSFDPLKEWKEDELKIQFVPQIKISGWDNMMNLHNEYVSKGWEGLVIRDPNKVYKPNARGQQMIKIKVYKEDTFKVVGIEQGLRLYDDMCFILETKSGNIFKAKPLGNRDQKIEYTKNFDSTYKGHLGDCKYFNISAHGVVEQPVFIAFRWDLE